MANQYEAARDIYAAWGVDTEEALRKMDTIPVSINCWQLDDLTGFEDFDAALTGGIAATGNAPGKPRSVEEYFVSLDKMLSLVPGAKHLALHAVYPLTNGVKVPRNEIRPEHFAGWVDYAREKGIGLDFNPTYFSHPMLRDNWTLASPEKEVRDFWVQHGIACRKIGEYFGRELGEVCITNHWIPDGSKDTRVDTLGPRERLVAILSTAFLPSRSTGSITATRSRVRCSVSVLRATPPDRTSFTPTTPSRPARPWSAWIPAITIRPRALRRSSRPTSCSARRS